MDIYNTRQTEHGGQFPREYDRIVNGVTDQCMIEFAFTTRIPLAVMIAIGIKQWENRAAMPIQFRRKDNTRWYVPSHRMNGNTATFSFGQNASLNRMWSLLCRHGASLPHDVASWWPSATTRHHIPHLNHRYGTKAIQSGGIWPTRICWTSRYHAVGGAWGCWDCPLNTISLEWKERGQIFYKLINCIQSRKYLRCSYTPKTLSQSHFFYLNPPIYHQGEWGYEMNFPFAIAHTVFFNKGIISQHCEPILTNVASVYFWGLFFICRLQLKTLLDVCVSWERIV